MKSIKIIIQRGFSEAEYEKVVKALIPVELTNKVLVDKSIGTHLYKSPNQSFSQEDFRYIMEVYADAVRYHSIPRYTVVAGTPVCMEPGKPPLYRLELDYEGIEVWVLVNHISNTFQQMVKQNTKA